MGTSYLQPGFVLDLTAPTGGVTKGVPVLIGGLFVIPTDTVAQTLPFRGTTGGVHTLTKLAGEGALAEGVPVYWDVANARFSIDATVGLPIGSMAAAAATGDTTGSVRLSAAPLGGRMLTIRKRFTTAQVNAGATLLPAIPGLKYRLVDAYAIAVGGAMTTNTTADILATLSAASRKLVSFAQAGMTQSSLVRAGAASGAILADGASFTANDAGTAVTVGNTGAGITVMTNLDVCVTYQLE